MFKPAILANADAIILAHNHPSGDPTPSSDDVAVAKRLREAGDLLHIAVLDALVVTDEGFWFSMLQGLQGQVKLPRSAPKKSEG